jgi:hypothetical protein
LSGRFAYREAAFPLPPADRFPPGCPGWSRESRPVSELRGNRSWRCSPKSRGESLLGRREIRLAAGDLPGSSPDDLVQAFDHAKKFLRGDPADPLPQAFTRNCTDLAHLDPGPLRKVALRQLYGQGKPRLLKLARDRIAMTVPERSLKMSWLMTRTGRCPACSRPRVGSRSAENVTPQYSGHDSRSEDALSSASSCS